MSSKIREYLDKLFTTKNSITTLSNYIKAKKSTKNQFPNLNNDDKEEEIESENLRKLYNVENTLENYINKNATTTLDLLLSEYAKLSGITPENIKLAATLNKELIANNDQPLEEFDIKKDYHMFNHSYIDFNLNIDDKQYYFKKKFKHSEKLSDGSSILDNIVVKYDYETDDHNKYYSLHVTNPEGMIFTFRTHNFIVFDPIMRESALSAIEKYSQDHEEPTL